MVIDETARLEPPTSDDRLIWDVWLSVYHFSSLAVADTLGLFPLLEEDPASSEEMAEWLSLGLRATEALVGVLASLGFLEQRHDRFHLTNATKNFLLRDRHDPERCHWHLEPVAVDASLQMMGGVGAA